MIKYAAAFALGAASVSVLWAFSSRASRPQTPSSLPLDSEELIQQQLVRNYQFFGKHAQDKIRQSYVVVVGLGGVGSHCVSLLARSGVSRIRVIDFDRVTLSSLNRHAFASRSDVGISKTECVRRYVKAILPSTVVEPIEALFSGEKAQGLLLQRYPSSFPLDRSPDLVIDCIDNVQTKVELLAFCKKRGIPVLSSMGAGSRIDPTRLQIADISETKECELARAVRKGLRKHSILSGITVVYSIERITHHSRKLMPLGPHQEQDPEEYRTLTNFRLRTIPVVGTMPALFGNTLATQALSLLAEQAFKPLLKYDISKETYEKMYERFKLREVKQFGASLPLSVALTDLIDVTEQLFKWRSVFDSQGPHSSVQLVRWDPGLPLSVRNVVLLTRKELTRHLKISSLEEGYSPEEIKGVNVRIEEYFNEV